MRPVHLMAFLITFSMAGTVSAQSIPKDIDVVAMQGRGTDAGRAAWERLSKAGTDAIVPLLDGMNTKDTAAANWLRTAFDAVIERELKNGGRSIDLNALLTFVKAPKNHGRARRLALEVVEKFQPGTSEKLNAGWLDDPEFRFD